MNKRVLLIGCVIVVVALALSHMLYPYYRDYRIRAKTTSAYEYANNIGKEIAASYLGSKPNQWPADISSITAAEGWSIHYISDLQYDPAIATIWVNLSVEELEGHGFVLTPYYHRRESIVWICTPAVEGVTDWRLWYPEECRTLAQRHVNKVGRMPRVERNRVKESAAKVLFAEDLKRRGYDPASFSSSFEPFGKTTMLIRASSHRIIPAHEHLYIMDGLGRIASASVEGIADLFRREYPYCPTEQKQMAFIQAFIALLEDHLNLSHLIDSSVEGDHKHFDVSDVTRLIINDIRDIPGYSESPLDEGMEGTVREPFKKSKTTWILYTYRQLGGVVQRYRFHFRDGKWFDDVTRIVLGSDIGAAWYLY